MYRDIIYCVFLTITGFVSFAQTPLPDSLERKFSGTPQDSNYVIELNKLATDYLKSNPNATREIASHVLGVAPKIDYKKGYARAMTLIGNSYWYEGVYEFAQRYYLLAAREYKIINDSIGLGQTYNNIGEVYKKLGEYDKSLEYLLASINLKRRDTTFHALTLYNIGELYTMMGETDRAHEYLQQSLEIALKENNKRVLAYDYWSLGILKGKAGQFSESLTLYNKAIALWKELGETRSLIQTYQDYADIYKKQKKYDSALFYLGEAISLASQIKVPDLQVNNYWGMFTLDSARSNYSQALRHLYRYTVLKDSVYNLLKTEQIARLQTIYETETRERENQQLRAERVLKDSQLKSQQLFLIGISISLVITGILAWMLFRQHRRILEVNRELKDKNEEIHLQKEAIESQAVALLKLNSELQELNKNLENRIHERTNQLMVQNQKLTEYTFVNAHKLRAPVASILGLLNLVDQVNPEERAGILQHLKTCGDQLDKIIREISRDLEAAIVDKKD
jgi:tetratricopeptide (TPR) repeat protein